MCWQCENLVHPGIGDVADASEWNRLMTTSKSQLAQSWARAEYRNQWHIRVWTDSHSWLLLFNEVSPKKTVIVFVCSLALILAFVGFFSFVYTHKKNCLPLTISTSCHNQTQAFSHTSTHTSTSCGRGLLSNTKMPKFLGFMIFVSFFTYYLLFLKLHLYNFYNILY